MLALTLLMRLAVGVVASQFVLQDFAPTHLLLLPLRDLLAPVIWAAGFMGNRIHWRGDVFDLKDGRLRRASS